MYVSSHFINSTVGKHGLWYFINTLIIRINSINMNYALSIIVFFSIHFCTKAFQDGSGMYPGSACHYYQYNHNEHEIIEGKLVWYWRSGMW